MATNCETCGTPLNGSLCPGCMFQLALTSDLDAEIESAPDLPRYFADHEILGEIARGGMGVVYRARRLEIDRLVALKVVRTGSLATPDARMRFKMEVEAISQLSHPHIISLYETGEVDDVHFFSMPLAEGELVRSNDMRGDLALFKKVVSAVRYAHSRGILHRDIKPSNILIDADGQPLLSDFGLVKHLGEDSSFTITRAVMGSPLYMAPEQKKGDELSTAADIYSLGAVLYELLTGQPPADASFGPDPRRKNSEVPKDLAAICQCCLEPSPSDRYASAANLEEDLQNWMEGRPVVARSRSMAASAWLWARRNPGLAAMVTLSILLVLALAIGATVAALRISQAQDLANSRLQNLQLEEIENLELSGRTTDSMAKRADYLSDHPEDEITRRQLFSSLGHRSFPVRMETKLRRLSGRLLTSVWAPHLITLETDGTLTEWTDSPRITQLPQGRRGLLNRSAAQALVFDQRGRIHHWERERGSRVLADLPDPLVWAISDDWSRLAIFDSEQTFSIFSFPECELLESRFVKQRFKKLVFSPDGKHLVSGSVSGHLLRWDVETLSGIQLTHERWRHFSNLTFSNDGSLIATGDQLGGIRIYTFPEGDPLNPVKRHGHQIHDLEFSADDQFLVSASEQNDVQIWHVETGHPYGEAARTTTGVRAAGFVKSDTGMRIGTVAHDGIVVEFELRRPLLSSEPQEISGRTSRFEGYGKVLFPTAGTVFHAPEHPGIESELVHSLRTTVHPDGRHAAMTKRGGVVEIRDILENRLLRSLRPPGGAVLHLDIKGDWLGTANHKRQLTLWNWKSGQELDRQPTLSGPVTDLIFSSDGSKYLACTSRRLTIYETATAEVLWEKRSRNHLFSSRFSPDGKYVVAAGSDGVALVWEIESEEPPRSFNHQDTLFHAAFSPCGSFLLTASFRNTVRLWDLESGRPVTIPIFISGKLTGAGFVEGSPRIVTTSANGLFQVWDTAEASTEFPLIDLARVMSGKNFAELQGFRRKLLARANDELTAWLLRREPGN